LKKKVDHLIIERTAGSVTLTGEVASIAAAHISAGMYESYLSRTQIRNYVKLKIAA
jgi:hypothetical protein